MRLTKVTYFQRQKPKVASELLTDFQPHKIADQ